MLPRAFASLAFAVLLLASCKANTISNETNNGTTVGTAQVVGPAGGLVVGPEGASVRIPAGALTVDTSIGIHVAEPSQYPSLPPDLQAASKVFAFEPHGLKFLTPVTLTLPLAGGPPDVVALRAEGSATPASGATAWQTFPVQVAVDAQLTTPGFSYYVLARAAADGGSSGSVDPTCAGRKRDLTAPTGTTTSFAGSFTVDGSTVDLGALVDGYAKVGKALYTGTPILELWFTDYAGACSYARDNEQKIGGKLFAVTTGAGAVGTYSAMHGGFGASGYAVPKDGHVGTTCGGPSTDLGDTNASTVTITAFDASHVAGSFAIGAASANTQLTGTFDVPVCAVPANAPCCFP